MEHSERNPVPILVTFSSFLLLVLVALFVLLPGDGLADLLQQVQPDGDNNNPASSTVDQSIPANALPNSKGSTIKIDSAEYAELIAQLAAADDEIARLSNQLSGLEASASAELDFIQQLVDAMAEHNVAVTVTEAGDIKIGQHILFRPDSAVLSSDGKAFLDKIIPVIASIVAQPDNIGLLKSLNVIGHTYPIGEVQNGYELSQNRSRSVVEYITGKQFTAMTADQKELLVPYLFAVGVSENHPILQYDGQPNPDASRRVEISITLANPAVVKVISDAKEDNE